MKKKDLVGVGIGGVGGVVVGGGGLQKTHTNKNNFDFLNLFDTNLG